MTLKELTYKRALLINELSQVDDEIKKARKEVYKNMLCRTYTDCLSRANMTHITVDDEVIQI